MDSRKCPGCGSPLGAGTLAGQCPRCLFAGDPRAQVTEDDHSDAKERVAAAVGILQADADSSAGAGDAVPLQDAVIGRRTDPLPRAELDSFPPPHLAAVDPAATWSDRAPAPRIEGYEVLREIKQGGQGVVYLAVQLSTKRKVAVKVLLAGMFASKPARRRFEREIELVASLKHPNIIAVFDSGSTPEGHDYYVMDYVRGVPLTQHVREKGLGIEQVLAMFATTCEAVNHAHLRGVIHRDLKPSNILVDAEGSVRVLDFGLAKALIEPAESIVSVTGNMVGTFPYMSPEQTRANPDEMDTRTDVYALGVVLYEALTGKHPYPVTGNVADIVRHIVETPPASPTRTWTGEAGVRTASGVGRRRKPGRCPIDGDLETILLKALSKERERRYDNAGHFARDIRRYLADEPIIARRPSAWYQARLFTRRHRALVIASVGIFLGLVLGVITTTLVAMKLKETNTRLTAATTRLTAATEAIGNFMAFGGDDMADRNDLIASRRLHTKALDEASARNLAGSSILAGLVEIGSRQGGEIPILGTFGRDAGPGGFMGHQRHATSVTVLKGRDRALTSNQDGTLMLWDLATGRLVDQVRDSKKQVAYVAVSPDGRWAATASFDGTVKKWEVESDKLVGGQVLFEHSHEIWMVAISPDGKRVVAGTGHQRILLWEGGETREIGEAGESVAALAFPPGDSRFALSSDGNGKISLWDLDTATRVWKEPVRHGDQQINCIAFSNDGQTVASVSFGGSIMIWDVRGSGAEMTLRGRPEEKKLARRWLWRAAFSPDDKTIAVASDDGNVFLVDANSQTLVRTFRAQPKGTMGVAFVDNDTVVSTGEVEGERDAAGLCVNSALMLWDTGGRVRHVDGAVAELSVDDDGAVTVKSATGTARLFIGRDGRLHAKREGGGSAAAWEPEADSSLPNWAQGGRSSAAANSGVPQQDVLVPLPGGKAQFRSGSDGTFQLWAPPRSGPGAAEGSPALMRTFHGHKGKVTHAAVSRNGRYLVSADENGGVIAWDLLHPLRCRALERRVQSAHKQLVSNPTDRDALSTLDEWYAFRGRKASVR